GEGVVQLVSLRCGASRPRCIRGAGPPLRPLGLRPRTPTPSRPRARGGCHAGDLRGRLALGRELPAAARAGSTLAVCGRAQRGRRPAAIADRAARGATGRDLARAGAGRARGDVVCLVARTPRARDASRARAGGTRARILERALAERGGEFPRHPARNGEDANAERSRASRGRLGRRSVMTLPPDFDELIGADVEGAERARLQRVHALLVQAGPPAELSPELEAPSLGLTLVRRHRRARRPVP